MQKSISSLHSNEFVSSIADGKLERANLTPQAMPLVSVIMPVDAIDEQTIAAVCSVQEQTHSNFELIFVMTGSQQLAPRICALFDDDRIRQVNSSRRNIADSLNAGLAHAKGHFVAFINRGEVWERDKLQTQVSHLAHRPMVDVSVAGWRGFDDKGAKVLRQARFNSGAINSHEILCTYRGKILSGSLIRMNAINPFKMDQKNSEFQAPWFDYSLPFHADTLFLVQLANFYEIRFEAMPQMLSCVRRQRVPNRQQLMSQLVCLERALKKIDETCPLLAYRDGEKARAKYLFSLAEDALLGGDPEFSISLLRDCVKIYPSATLAYGIRPALIAFKALWFRLRDGDKASMVSSHAAGVAA